MTSVRELSGVLSDLGKWESTWDVLVSEECSIQHLRVYHNQPEQLQSTCSRLLANRSVTALDVGVAEGQGCSALAELLMASQHIQTLNIQALSNSDLDTAALAAGLRQNHSIQQLTLQNLQLSALVQLSHALTAGGCAGQLHQLKLPGARLDPQAAAALQLAVLAQPHLEVLSLQSASFVRTRSIAAAPEQQQQQTSTECLLTAALAWHPCLQRMELQQASGLQPAAVGSFLASAVAAGTALQAVLLDSANLRDEGMQQLTAAALDRLTPTNNANYHAVAADASPAMQQHCHCHINMLHTFGEPITTHNGLKELSLSNNSIGPQGARSLGQLLGSNPGFKHLLNLSQNALGSEGLAVLVEGIVGGTSCWCCLEELRLESNSIKGLGGLVALINSPAGKNLRTLDLSQNCIADEAACQLAAALTVASSSSSRNSCSSLQHLDLSSNWIKDDGAQGLADYLKSQRTLVTLQLAKNRLGCKGIDAVILAAFATAQLQQVSLEGNRVKDQRTKLDIEGLTRALASRRASASCNRQVSIASASTVSGGPSIGRGFEASAITATFSDGSSSERLSHACEDPAASADLAASASRRSISSSPPGSPRAKQGYEQRVASSFNVTADATASVTAPGRAAKFARLELGNNSNNSAGPLAALGTEAVTAITRPEIHKEEPDDMDHAAEPGVGGRVMRTSSGACPPSPFAPQAHCKMTWEDEPTFVSNRNTTKAAAATHAEEVVEHSLSGMANVPPAHLPSHEDATRDPSDLSATKGVSLCSPAEGIGGLLIPEGFVQKLLNRSNRSCSLDFWARSGSSSNGPSLTGVSSNRGAVPWGSVQTHGSLEAAGSLGFCLESWDPSLLDDASIHQPLDASLLPVIGLAARGFSSVDSLSGWMLDDAFDGQIVWSGLGNAGSLSRATSLATVGGAALVATVALVRHSSSSSGEKTSATGVRLARQGSSDGSGADNNSGGKVGSPKAAGMIRRLESGGLLVRLGSLSGSAVIAGRKGPLSRFGQAVAARQQ